MTKICKSYKKIFKNHAFILKIYNFLQTLVYNSLLISALKAMFEAVIVLWSVFFYANFLLVGYFYSRMFFRFIEWSIHSPTANNFNPPPSPPPLMFILWGQPPYV